MTANAVVIAGSARTPMGGFLGELASISAPELGSAAIRAAIERGGLRSEIVGEVLMGCVLSAGLGQAPARQAALGAGLSKSTPCTTLNKMCGSGMQAVILGHDRIRAGSQQVVIAGGMESMSNAPYLVEKARSGLRMGHGRILDHMFLDGLEDAYDRGRAMGAFAEDCAQRFGYSRAEQDAFAIASLSRARNAIDRSLFDAETVTVEIKKGKQQLLIKHDEQPHKVVLEKIPGLRPVFREGGTVTAANSSSISDGGAALLLMSADAAARHGVRAEAKIIGHSVFADEPALFPLAPVGAIRDLLDKVGWEIRDVDLFEVNEAFAVVSMITMRELGIPHERMNVHGGACALGHPIGSSGARIIVTLIHALRARQLRRGVAAVCIGGGEATAIAIELE